MTSHDITVTDLERISKGVEGEEHEGTECAPVMETCKYSRGSFVMGDVVAFFDTVDVENIIDKHVTTIWRN